MDNKEKNIFSLSLDIDFSSEQKISDLISKYTVRVLYLGENRNGSYFTKEVVEKMINTLGGIPVIGHYDEEKHDFLGHGDLQVIVTENGDVETKRVGPVPYGFVPLNPRTWWEKHVDKDSVEREYLCTETYLWTGRYDELSILKDNKNNQSMELNPATSIGQWTDMDSGCWYVFTEAEFLGLCILGQDVEPCFEGAGFTTNFALNSSFSEKLATMKEELQFALNEYENSTVEEGNETEPEVAENTEIEPTVEELKEIEKEGLELNPEDLEIDSSIDMVSQEEYEKVKEELRQTQQDLLETKKNYIALNEDFTKVKEQLQEYKNKELMEEKLSLLEQYSSYIPNDKYEEIKNNISEYDLKTLDTLAVTTAFQYMKQAMSTIKVPESNGTEFTLADEAEVELPDDSWQAAVLKTQKQMKQGG